MLGGVFAGEIEKEEADKMGLVPSHAYAVLDVKEINGTRLLQVGQELYRRVRRSVRKIMRGFLFVFDATSAFCLIRLFTAVVGVAGALVFLCCV